MEECGEVTVICVDTSITNPHWFHDQINAVQIYLQFKVKDDYPYNLVGIVTSTKLAYGGCFAPTSSLKLLCSILDYIKAHAQENIDVPELSDIDWFNQPEYKKKQKRLVLFSGSPLLSTYCQSTSVIAKFLQPHVVLDVVDFGPRLTDEEDWKTKTLKALVDSMNNNNDENESSRYFLIEHDGFSLYRHILRSSILDIHRLSGGEITMICVDTSITSKMRFYDQIDAVEIYCRHILKVDPKNFVGIARFGQRDVGIALYPTNCLEIVTSMLHALYPLDQEYSDLFQVFDVIDGDWFGQQDMKKRIVVFSGSPLPSTTTSKSIAYLLQKIGVVLDVVVFGTRVKDEEDRRAEYFKALVDSVNHDDAIHYLRVEDDGFSLSHHISSSHILLKRSSSSSNQLHPHGRKYAP